MHPAGVVPFSCPWCNAAATPGPAPQACASCKRRFTLSVGPALDPRVVAPIPHPATMKITVKWSAIVTYRFATLDAGGVISGTLDPVLAVAPIDQVGIAFPDIGTIAIWRKIGWSSFLVGLAVPLPIGLFSALGGALMLRSSVGAGIFTLVFGLAFLAVAAIMIQRGAIIGRRRARIVGRLPGQFIEMELGTGSVFHDQLFRRAGLIPPAIP